MVQSGARVRETEDTEIKEAEEMEEDYLPVLKVRDKILHNKLGGLRGLV